MKYIVIPQEPVQFWHNLIQTPNEHTYTVHQNKESRETPIAEAVNPVGHQLPNAKGCKQPQLDQQNIFEAWNGRQVKPEEGDVRK